MSKLHAIEKSLKDVLKTKNNSLIGLGYDLFWRETAFPNIDGDITELGASIIKKQKEYDDAKQSGKGKETEKMLKIESDIQLLMSKQKDLKELKGEIRYLKEQQIPLIVTYVKNLEKAIKNPQKIYEYIKEKDKKN